MIGEANRIAAAENGYEYVNLDVVFSQQREEDRFLYRLVGKIGGEEIVVERDITHQAEAFHTIQNTIFVVNMVSLILIPFVAGLYSFFLAYPIRDLTEEIAQMNEKSVSPIAANLRVPMELRPLTETLNRLLARIEGHTSYQRELFVGVAHELRTPLAVIRARNDVVLLKERSIKKYQETLKDTNRTIDEMNMMTRTILEIGRAESAQFVSPEIIDLPLYINEKAKEFALLTAAANRKLEYEVEPNSLMVCVKSTLIGHILNNLFSNALKYTPEGKTITIKSVYSAPKYTIAILDEGDGIEPLFDPFAPFVGKGELKGVGLGLYIAKGAAMALAGTISLKKREDRNGTLAVFSFEPVLQNQAAQS
jgi:two-component system OmpR family sensor kinase